MTRQLRRTLILGCTVQCCSHRRRSPQRYSHINIACHEVRQQCASPERSLPASRVTDRAFRRMRGDCEPMAGSGSSCGVDGVVSTI